MESRVIPSGESGKVIVTWKPAEEPSSDRQTATILTDDPARPQVELAVSGRVKVILRSSPSELALGHVSAGEAATAETRLWCYLDEPLKIVGHQWSDAAADEHFEAAIQPLSAEDVGADPLARSGVRACR